MILLYFSRRGSLPMGTTGARLQVHRTSATSTVERLEAAKLVRRCSHPTDTRATLVELTAAGHTLAVKATKALNEEALTEPRQSPRGIITLVEVLGQMRHGAGDF